MPKRLSKEMNSLAEQKAERSEETLRDVAEEVLEITGVKDPSDDEEPTRTSPAEILAKAEYAFSARGGFGGKGVAEKWYRDDKGKVIYLINPDEDFRRQHLFNGNFIPVDSEDAHPLTKTRSPSVPSIDDRQDDITGAAQRIVMNGQPLIRHIPGNSKNDEPAPVIETVPTAAELRAPIEQLYGLTESLSDDDKLNLRAYAEAAIEVAEAQKEGRGNDSRYWQGIKAQYQKDLSTDAWAVASRYTSIYKRLNS